MRDPTRDQVRSAQLDPLLSGGLPLEPSQIAEIVTFMEAFTDPRARVPVRVPSSGPSGLSVD